MSMTKEEASKHLLLDWHINLGCDFAIKSGRLDDFLAALDVALSALRPVTREQVEKVWRGEWIQEDPPVEFYICSKCGESAVATADHGYHYRSTFCPHCGAPMTDKAVDMVMERLEALKDDSTAD